MLKIFNIIKSISGLGSFSVGVLILLITACTGSKQGPATISLSFPKDSHSVLKAKSLAQKEVLSAVDYSLLCFAVNVVGTDINSSARTCDIPKGLFAGSVAAGGSLALTVNAGSTINVQIYGLLKSNPSDVCPTGLTSSWNWPLQKVYFLGETDSVLVQAPSTAVSVEVSMPDVSQNLVVQENLPATCVLASSTGGVGGTGTGGGLMAGTHFQVSALTGPTEQLNTLTGSKFKVTNSRVLKGKL